MRCKRLVSIALPLALILLPAGCRKESASPDCTLVSFVVRKADNPGLREDISFSFDREKHTLKAMYLHWIDGQDPKCLVARYSIEGASATLDGKKVSGEKCTVDFSETVTFNVKAENGNSTSYKITLNCPQVNTELPVLRLQPSSPIVSRSKYVSAKATLYSPDTKKGWWKSEDGDIEVRGRGNSTWTLPKKPYRLRFPEKFSPIGLDHASERSWVILAHDMDKSLLRNHLAFALSRILFNPDEHRHDPSAIMFTPCSRFVNVYMDNEYHGVYQMSDQMGKGDGRIAVEKAGGHIIESDIHGSEAPPVRFNSAVKNIQFNHKYPDPEDPGALKEYTAVETLIGQAEKALYGSSFTNPATGWRKYFDEKTLVDYIIVKELAGDMDGYTSTYLYKRSGVDKLFFGPIWDVDKGWDNEKRGGEGYLDKLMIHSGFHMPVFVSDDWFNRFWQDPSLRQAVKLRWKQKKMELLDAVYGELDTMPHKMEKAIEANFSVWPFYYQASGEAKMPSQDYPSEIARIRSLTASRAATLDKLFN